MLAASLAQASLALSKVSLYWPSGERRWNTPRVVSRREEKRNCQVSPLGWQGSRERTGRAEGKLYPGCLGEPLAFEVCRSTSFKILISFRIIKNSTCYCRNLGNPSK